MGGAIFAYETSLELQQARGARVEITDCSATDTDGYSYGGAIAFWRASYPTGYNITFNMIGVDIKRSTAHVGGGVSINDKCNVQGGPGQCSRLNHGAVAVRWYDVLFESCAAIAQASERTDMMYYMGGGAYIVLADKESVILDSVTFRSCRAAWRGGGLEALSSLIIMNSRFEQCSAGLPALTNQQPPFYGQAGGLYWESQVEAAGAVLGTVTKGQDGLATFRMNYTDFIECTSTVRIPSTGRLLEASPRTPCVPCRPACTAAAYSP